MDALMVASEEELAQVDEIGDQAVAKQGRGLGVWGILGFVEQEDDVQVAAVAELFAAKLCKPTTSANGEQSVALDGRAVFVVGRNLCSAVVDEDRFGRRAVAAVQARVPATRWLPRPRTAGDNLVGAASPAAGTAARP